MKLKKLLRRNIEPRCIYCLHGIPLSDEVRVVCRRMGVVDGTQSCRAFTYDPMRRVPPRPAVLRGQFTAADFSLGDLDEE